MIYIWAIALLFLVGLIVSGVAYTSRRRASDATLLRRQATALQGYSRDVVAADNNKAIVSITSEAIAALFHVPVVVMLISEGDVASIDRIGGLEPEAADFEAARSSLVTGSIVRAGIYPALTSRFDFWPVTTPLGQRAVIGLAFNPDRRPPAPDTVVDVVGSILALALERQYFGISRDTRPAH